MQAGESEPDRAANGPHSERPADRELLWVESVSERLLGGQPARPWERVYFDREDEPPAAERPPQSPAEPTPGPTPEPPPTAPAPGPGADSTESATPPPSAPHTAPETPVVSVTTTTVPPAPAAERTPPTTSAPTTEGDHPAMTQPATSEASATGAATTVADASRVLDLTDTAGDRATAVPTEDGILHTALLSGDASFAGAVIDLLDSRVRDRARIASLERTLRVLLTEVERSPEALTGSSPAGASLAAVLRRVLRS